jgi:hypothetical protein
VRNCSLCTRFVDRIRSGLRALSCWHTEVAARRVAELRRDLLLGTERGGAPIGSKASPTKRTLRRPTWLLTRKVLLAATPAIVGRPAELAGREVAIVPALPSSKAAANPLFSLAYLKDPLLGIGNFDHLCLGSSDVAASAGLSGDGRASQRERG